MLIGCESNYSEGGVGKGKKGNRVGLIGVFCVCVLFCFVLFCFVLFFCRCCLCTVHLERKGTVQELVCMCGCVSVKGALYHFAVMACDLLISSHIALRGEEACCGNCARCRNRAIKKKQLRGKKGGGGSVQQKAEKRGSSLKCSFFALPIELASVFVCFSIGVTVPSSVGNGGGVLPYFILFFLIVAFVLVSLRTVVVLRKNPPLGCRCCFLSVVV